MKSTAVASEKNRDDINVEFLKIQADTTKHITTLATGTLVILATFMDKLPKPLVGTRELIVAIVCMLVCLLTAFVYLWAMTLMRFQEPIFGAQNGVWRVRETPRLILAHVMYFSFCGGIGALAKFAIMNVHHLQK